MVGRDPARTLVRWLAFRGTPPGNRCLPDKVAVSYFDEPSSYSTTIVHLSGGRIVVGGFVTVPLPVAMMDRLFVILMPR
jgi:hypothetical protein